MYCDRIYFRVNCGLPRLLAFLVDNNIEDGSSVTVHGRLRVDQYTNNRGVRATSLAVVAQRIRLDARIDLAVSATTNSIESEEVTAVEIVSRLQRSRLIQTASMAELSHGQTTIMPLVRESTLVTQQNANVEDLLVRLGSDLCNQIACRDTLVTVTAEVIVGLLPDSVTRSQARTFLDEITPPPPPPPPREPSTRPMSRLSNITDMEDYFRFIISIFYYYIFVFLF